MGSYSSKPEFTSQIADKRRVKRGEDIVFHCEVNLEDVKVIWEKDGQRLDDGGRISIRQRGTDLSLRISRANEKDEGHYTVRISRGPDSVSHSAEVTVLEYDRDWRQIKWGENVSIKHSLQDLTLRNPQVKHLNFLLHGPVGAGKSSIINSIQSIFQERVQVGALAGTSFTSFTKTYSIHQIIDRQTGALPFVFSDIMGLEDRDMEGLHPDDIISILKGNVREGYEFNSTYPLSIHDRSYNSSPTRGDQIHCLVSVLPAETISLRGNSGFPQETNVFDKMRAVREHASDLGIPQVVVMTRVDLACPLVKDDLRCIYSSKCIKRKMKECSTLTGVPMNCIFPVRNYHEENNLNGDMDSLILDALKNVVHFAKSYVDDLGRIEH